MRILNYKIFKENRKQKTISIVNLMVKRKKPKYFSDTILFFFFYFQPKTEKT